FCFQCFRHPRALHSFPTRRSSDLTAISGTWRIRGGPRWEKGNRRARTTDQGSPPPSASKGRIGDPDRRGGEARRGACGGARDERRSARVAGAAQPGRCPELRAGGAGAGRGPRVRRRHRRGAPGGPVDVSSDLREMSGRPVCGVCAGPKAILDVPATAEALETLGVPVIGFRTSELPAFYTEGSGVVLEHRVEDAAEMAKLLRAHFYDLGLGTGVILAVPPPSLLPREEIEAAIAAALAEARTRRLPGKEVTPFLLG